MKKIFAVVMMLAILLSCIAASAESAEDLWFELNADATILTVRLEANATTGYQWICTIDDESVLEEISEDYVPDAQAEGLAGAGGIYTADFQAASAQDGANPGEVYLTFDYMRPWEEGSWIKSYTLQLHVDEDGKITVDSDLFSGPEPEAEDGGIEIAYGEDGRTFTLRLPANAGTEYEWKADFDQEMLELAGEEYTSQEDGAAVYTADYRVLTANPFETLLTYTYARAWEEGEVPDSVLVFSVQITEDGTLIVG